jgi:hypothetical protein
MRRSPRPTAGNAAEIDVARSAWEKVIAPTLSDLVDRRS